MFSCAPVELATSSGSAAWFFLGATMEELLLVPMTERGRDEKLRAVERDPEEKQWREEARAVPGSAAASWPERRGRAGVVDWELLSRPRSMGGGCGRLEVGLAWMELGDELGQRSGWGSREPRVAAHWLVGRRSRGRWRLVGWLGLVGEGS